MTYTFAECTVNNSDDGHRNCPKHVEFHFQNKFEKLVQLVGFIIRKFVTLHGHMNVKFVSSGVSKAQSPSIFKESELGLGACLSMGQKIQKTFIWKVISVIILKLN
jgi:hypothetical protein